MFGIIIIRECENYNGIFLITASLSLYIYACVSITYSYYSHSFWRKLYKSNVEKKDISFVHQYFAEYIKSLKRLC